MNTIFYFVPGGLLPNIDLNEQWAPSLTAHDPDPPLPLLPQDNQAMFFLAQ